MKACQPLGAYFAAIGFEKTLVYSHGSQGCNAYFRTHLARHFKEPFFACSSAMTEDTAVFGGYNNMYEGLENACTLYKPSMIAVNTTCMAEVIGDDLNAFIKNAKEKGHIPEDLPVPYAHTPSFVGSHIIGYDNMMYGILSQMSKPSGERKDRINVIVGFDTYIENFREIKRILNLFGVNYIILSDPSDVLDSPTDGNYRMYYGGTKLEELKDAANSKATILLQKYTTRKTEKLIREDWDQEVKVVNPIGIKGSDELILAISELTGKEIPEQIEVERGRALDAMADSYYWLYGKQFAFQGDPDLAYGLSRFLMELGAEPVHVMCTNGTREWLEDMEKLKEEFFQGKEMKVYAEKDMWHLRTLLMQEFVPFLIGTSYHKYLERDLYDLGFPVKLIRIGYPIFDRHHLHRFPTIGYKGAIQLLTWIVNAVLEYVDNNTRDMAITDYSYDLIR
ncbi:MAG: nitrogenase molybdenum-iron protein subunit beta [Hydrogenothermaceae bacterium]|nr:nitrogenase molybdenum-iron protein subunit beta [Hydrogenothermaceae bacterium]